MPMPPYIQSLRAKIGHDLLMVPGAAVLIFDDAGRVLLVRQKDGGMWSTPGGTMEPGESPAETAVREAWEETGLLVELIRVVGVFGGEEFTLTYTNGDRMAWMSTVFEGRIVGGTIQTNDGNNNDEIWETGYFSHEEAVTLSCRPHVREVLNAAFAHSSTTYFRPTTWKPDTL